MRFNQKIAKQIANNSMQHVVGGILGTDDPDYSLDDDISQFETNFEEDLQKMGINPTLSKIEKINIQFEKQRAKLIKYLENFIGARG
jgi:hypothetical protein